MIFDIKDAFLIAGSLIFVVFGFVSCFVKQTDCDDNDHTFAEYQSTKERICIDCGYRESIEKPHYPKHQR